MEGWCPLNNFSILKHINITPQPVYMLDIETLVTGFSMLPLI